MSNERQLSYEDHNKIIDELKRLTQDAYQAVCKERDRYRSIIDSVLDDDTGDLDFVRFKVNEALKKLEAKNGKN